MNQPNPGKNSALPNLLTSQLLASVQQQLGQSNPDLTALLTQQLLAGNSIAPQPQQQLSVLGSLPTASVAPPAPAPNPLLGVGVDNNSTVILQQYAQIVQQLSLLKQAAPNAALLQNPTTTTALIQPDGPPAIPTQPLPEATDQSQGALTKIIQSAILAAIQSGQINGSVLSHLIDHNPAAVQPNVLSAPQLAPASFASPVLGADEKQLLALGSAPPPAVQFTVGNAATAREKNRQAQRRFRERQKSRINTLEDENASLKTQLDSAQREIALLREEATKLRQELDAARKPAGGTT